MKVVALIPSFDWLRRYPTAWLRSDLTAGLTASAVVVPKALAFATIAGLPLEVGLYTAIVPMAVYAFLGTSRPLSVSTTTTIAILTAAELTRLAPDGDTATLVGLVATLSFVVGLLLCVASLLRLGFVANFISAPVLTGFKAGIGIVIVVDQLPKLLGVHFEKTGFVNGLVALVREVPATSVPTLLLALAVLALLVGFERFAPRLPAPLIGIGMAILASAVLDLEAMGVAVVGAVAGGLPHVTLPRLELFDRMWADAAGIALMSFTESIAAARAFSSPGEPNPRPNQELFALGAANLAGGLLGAMPAGGGTSQTAVNRLAGARSQVSALITAAAALAALLALGPVIGLLPEAALAAVVVLYSLELIKVAEFAAIRRVRATELWWAATACAGVVLLGTLPGILVAVVVSLLSLAQQAYNPAVYVLGRKPGTSVFRPPSASHPGDETWPGLLILRTEGRLFFANAQRLADRARRLIDKARPRVVALDCRAIFDIEYTAMQILAETDEKLERDGIVLWLVGLNPRALAMVRRSPLGDRLGDRRMFANLAAAVREFERQSAEAGATITR